MEAKKEAQLHPDTDANRIPLPHADWFHMTELHEYGYFSLGGWKGDGGDPRQAQLNTPWDVAIFPDDETSFLIADRLNHCIRKVHEGIITTVAGAAVDVGSIQPKSCVSRGDGGLAIEALMCEPTGVDLPLDSKHGLPFVVAERQGSRIRWVDGCGKITSLSASPPATRITPDPPRPRITAAGLEAVMVRECDETWSTAIEYHGCQTRSRLGVLCKHRQTDEDPDGFRQRFCTSVSDELGCYVESGEWQTCNERTGWQGFVKQSLGSSLLSQRLHWPITSSNCSTQPAVSMLRPPLEFVDVHAKNLQSTREEDGNALAKAVAVATGTYGEVYVVDQARGVNGALYILTRQTVTCANQQKLFSWKHHRCVCPNGTYVSASGSCLSCQPGHYCHDERQYKCPWPKLTLRVLPANSSTRQCHSQASTEFRLLPSTACLDVEGATSVQECACPHSWHLVDGKCYTCPPGLLCAVHGQSASTAYALQNNYWSPVRSDGAWSILKCSQAHHCWWTSYVELWNASIYRGCTHNLPDANVREHCPSQGGFVGGTPGTCHSRSHREGVTCGRCSDGFFEDILGICTPCQGMSFWFILQPIVLSIFLVKFYSFLNNPKGGKFMASYMLSNAASSLLEFVQQYALLANIKLLPEISLLKWFRERLPHLPFVVQFQPISCVWGHPQQGRYPADLLGLPALTALCLFTLFLVSCLTEGLRSRLPEKLKVFSRGGRVGTYLQTQLKSIRTFKMEKQKAFNTLGFLICALYTYQTQMALALFNLQEQPQQQGDHRYSNQTSTPPTLRMYPDIQWRDRRWWLLLPYCSCGLFYSIALFVFHVKITYQAPHRFTNELAFRTRHKYFYAKYREDRYYWGVFVMLKVIFLNVVGVGSLFGDTLRLAHVQIVFFINLIFMLLLLIMQPYKVNLNSHLDVAIAAVFLCFLILNLVDTGEFHTQLITPIMCIGALPLLHVVASAAYPALLPARWSRAQDAATSHSACLVKMFCSRLTTLSSSTMVALAKSFSPPERDLLRPGVRLLESLGSAHDPGDIALRYAPSSAVTGSWSRSTLFGSWIARSMRRVTSVVV